MRRRKSLLKPGLKKQKKSPQTVSLRPKGVSWDTERVTISPDEFASYQRFVAEKNRTCRYMMTPYGAYTRTVKSGVHIINKPALSQDIGKRLEKIVLPVDDKLATKKLSEVERILARAKTDFVPIAVKQFGDYDDETAPKVISQSLYLLKKSETRILQEQAMACHVAQRVKVGDVKYNLVWDDKTASHLYRITTKE